MKAGNDGGPKVLDLFSGIGGFALAFEAAGFQTIAFSEIEPYPCKILAQHWPQVPNLGGVRGINGEDYRGTVDVVCGGFPCQPHSLSGKRLAEKDPRDLWPEMVRIIAGCRPSWVLAENVPGLSDGFLDGVCADLEGIGYSVLPVEVPACAVGAPHQRYRLWLVAHSESLDGEIGMDVHHEFQESKQPRGHESMSGLWVEPPPGPTRVVDGVPREPHRIKTLGNSIVPAVCYPFALWIYNALKATK
jgi:DNA (cytosine-5)-methyltransferase 1